MEVLPLVEQTVTTQVELGRAAMALVVEPVEVVQGAPARAMTVELVMAPLYARQKMMEPARRATLTTARRTVGTSAPLLGVKMVKSGAMCNQGGGNIVLAHVPHPKPLPALSVVQRMVHSAWINTPMMARPSMGMSVPLREKPLERSGVTFGGKLEAGVTVQAPVPNPFSHLLHSSLKESYLFLSTLYSVNIEQDLGSLTLTQGLRDRVL